MFLHRVHLQAAAAYIATDLNDTTPVGLDGADGAGAAVLSPTQALGERIYLNSKDSRQYLFKLTPKDENDASLRTNTTLGKLDVVWRTNFGEQGRLQTSQLSRKPPPVWDIEVKVLKAPGEVQCGEGFSVSVAVKNCSAATMELSLREEQQKVETVLLDGRSGSTFDALPPGGSTVLVFEQDFALFRSAFGIHEVATVEARPCISVVGEFMVDVARVEARSCVTPSVW
jgi:hypothetical protein